MTPRDMGKDLKVVYLLGWVRSGSTILDVALGSTPGFFSCGELRYLWDRGLQKKWMCGCRQPLPDCPVWSRVVERLFPSGISGPELESIEDQHLAVVRTRKLPRVLRQRPGAPSGWNELDEYVDLLGRLYHAIAEETGSRVLVDSSKFAQDAALLRLVPGIEVCYVHMVRDPRAVAYSNQRRRTSQPDPDEPVEMALWSPSRSGARWARFNLAAEAVIRRHAGGCVVRTRYEDIMATPRAAITNILDAIGEGGHGPPFVDDDTVHLAPNHTVWGNPARFQTGPTSLKPDDEWVRRSTRKQIIGSSLASAPLMLRYGYPLKAADRTRSLGGANR